MTFDTAVFDISLEVNVLTLLGDCCDVAPPVPAEPEPFAVTPVEPVCAYETIESAGAESCVIFCAAPLSVIGVLLAVVPPEFCALASA